MTNKNMIQKCTVCGEESKALHLHMKKHEKEIVNYATKADLDEIKSLIASLAQSTIASKGPEKIETIETKIEEKAIKPDVEPIPQKYRLLVDEVLGPEFGINVSYPDSGGFLFKIIVPLDISNATSAHKEFYKSDVRTRSIPHSEGMGGIRKWIEKVANNLNIKPKNKT